MFNPLFTISLTKLGLTMRHDRDIFRVRFLIISVIFLLNFTLGLTVRVPLVQLPMSTLLGGTFLLLQNGLKYSLVTITTLVNCTTLFILLPTALSFLLVISGL